MISEYKEVVLKKMEERLQLMEEAMLQLEQDGNSDQLIQYLFRTAHTLKGSSASVFRG